MQSMAHALHKFQILWSCNNTLQTGVREGGGGVHEMKGVKPWELEEIKKLETYQKKFTNSNRPTTTVV